jgi:membrane protein YqaA with SNARE-associated domain
MDLSVLIGAALTSAAGGILPWISSEVVILGAALVLPATQLPLLVLLCAIGQVAGKSVMYGLTRWAPDKLPARAQAMLAKTERWREHRVLLGGGVLSGALVSVPPFFLVTLAAGALRLSYPVFLTAAFLGTLGRYGTIIWLAVRAGIGT